MNKIWLSEALNQSKQTIMICLHRWTDSAWLIQNILDWNNILNFSGGFCVGLTPSWLILISIT